MAHIDIDAIKGMPEFKQLSRSDRSTLLQMAYKKNDSLLQEGLDGYNVTDNPPQQTSQTPEVTDTAPETSPQGQPTQKEAHLVDTPIYAKINNENKPVNAPTYEQNRIEIEKAAEYNKRLDSIAQSFPDVYDWATIYKTTPYAQPRELNSNDLQQLTELKSSNPTLYSMTKNARLAFNKVASTGAETAASIVSSLPGFKSMGDGMMEKIRPEAKDFSASSVAQLVGGISGALVGFGVEGAALNVLRMNPSRVFNIMNTFRNEQAMGKYLASASDQAAVFLADSTVRQVASDISGDTRASVGEYLKNIPESAITGAAFGGAQVLNGGLRQALGMATIGFSQAAISGGDLRDAGINALILGGLHVMNLPGRTPDMGKQVYTDTVRNLADVFESRKIAESRDHAEAMAKGIVTQAMEHPELLEGKKLTELVDGWKGEEVGKVIEQAQKIPPIDFSRPLPEQFAEFKKTMDIESGKKLVEQKTGIEKTLDAMKIQKDILISQKALKLETVPENIDKIKAYIESQKEVLAKLQPVKKEAVNGEGDKVGGVHEGEKAPVVRSGEETQGKKKIGKQDSLRSEIIKRGGLSSEGLKHLGYKLDTDNKDLLSVARKNGQGIDVLATDLANAGLISIPENRHPDDYLIELLKEESKTGYSSLITEKNTQIRQAIADKNEQDYNDQRPPETEEQKKKLFELEKQYAEKVISHVRDNKDEQPNLQVDNGVDEFFRDGGIAEPALMFGGPDPRAVLKEVMKDKDISEAVNTIKQVGKDIQSLIAPSVMEKVQTKEGEKEISPEHGKEIFRANLGKLARSHDKISDSLKTIEKVFDKLPTDYNIDVINRAETGQEQIDPKLTEAMNTLQGMLKDEYKKIIDMGKGKLESVIENYFPHFWKKDEGQAGDIYKRIFGKKPFEGSAGFRKQRTFETLKDGLEAGYVPEDPNPVRWTILKMREMQKFRMAHETLNTFKEEGLAQFVRIGGDVPKDWQLINDKVSTVYKSSDIPIPQKITAPGEELKHIIDINKGKLDDQNSPKQTVNAGGLVVSGHIYAHPDIARIVNNYLSPGLQKYAAFNIWRGTGNLLNQAQLGLSAFHLGFTSIDAMVSKLAVGIRFAVNGNIGGAIRSILGVPGAAVTNLISGDKLLKAWYGKPLKGTDVELYGRMANIMAVAGGRAKMDDFYASKVSENIGQLFKQGRIIKGILSTPLSILEKISSPLMKYIVPRQKMGVFADIVKFEMSKNKNATDEELMGVAQKAWDSVDNRMGQLVYDNLFWNKVLKDSLMASVRSVGWNLGTIREVGGGILDFPKALIDLSRGRKPEFTNRMAYCIALPLLSGIMGAIYQYLRTGEGPKDVKDLYFPRNGKVDRNGDPARDSLPTYMKDLYHYKMNPIGTLANKANPSIGLVIDTLNNKDFYGVEIRHKDDPVIKQLNQEVAYLFKQAIPFGFRNVSNSPSKDAASRVLPFVGIVPAPRDVNSTKAELVANEISKSKIPPGSKTQEEFDKNRAVRNLRMEFLNKDKSFQDDFNSARNSGNLSVNDIKKIMDSSKTVPLIRQTKSFSAVDVMNVYDKADDEEKKQLLPVLRSKVMNELKGKSMDREEKIKLRKQYMAIIEGRR